MADHTYNSLGAATKALTDVVAGALDSADPLAREQLGLVVAYLEFVRSRMDFLVDRERFEVRNNLDLARSVRSFTESLGEPIAADLDEAIRLGESVIGIPAPMSELRRARMSLEAALREMIRAAGKAGGNETAEIERQVLDASARRIEMERAWYLPMGFDQRPDEVRDLVEVLGA